MFKDNFDKKVLSSIVSELKVMSEIVNSLSLQLDSKTINSERIIVEIGVLKAEPSHFLNMISDKLDKHHSLLADPGERNMLLLNNSIYKTFENGVWVDDYFYDLENPTMSDFINALKKTEDLISNLTKEQKLQYFKDTEYFQPDIEKYMQVDGIRKIEDPVLEKIFLMNNVLSSYSCSLLITDEGQPAFGKLTQLMSAGYHVTKGESDSFGWLSGIISIKNMKFVYG